MPEPEARRLDEDERGEDAGIGCRRDREDDAPIEGRCRRQGPPEGAPRAAAALPPNESSRPLGENGRVARLLVLGAGPAQLGVLAAARARGLTVVVADRDPSAPGFRYADRRAIVSIEDEPAIERLARAEEIDGVDRPGHRPRGRARGPDRGAARPRRTR